MAVFTAYWPQEYIDLCENTPNWSMSCWGSKLGNFSTSEER